MPRSVVIHTRAVDLASYTKSLETLGSFTTGVKPPGSFVRTEVYISGWVCLFSSQSWAFGVPGRGLFKNAIRAIKEKEPDVNPSYKEPKTNIPRLIQ